MKKALLTVLILLCTVFMLVSCDKKGTDSETTAKENDWRNTIEYEGSFFVNRETKLLYALDKGSIILWDNKGDGKPLQELDYETSVDNAIEDTEFTDVNLDGHTDIRVIFLETTEQTRYHLWLWNENDGKYTKCSEFRTIPNPVVTDDGTKVIGTLDKKLLGCVTYTYSFAEDLSLVRDSVELTNADDIARELAVAFCPAPMDTVSVSKLDGIATIEETECRVYGAIKDGVQIAYLAYTNEADWYIDLGCIGAYKRILAQNEYQYGIGEYTDSAGDVFPLAVSFYHKYEDSMKITKVSKGKLIDLAVNEDGVIMLPEADEAGNIDFSGGMDAECFEITYDESYRFSIIKTSKLTYYLLDQEVNGDSYFRLLSSGNEVTVILERPAMFQQN